jgi:tetratricopeptide (TPR) repeat protein
MQLTTRPWGRDTVQQLHAEIAALPQLARNADGLYPLSVHHRPFCKTPAIHTLCVCVIEMHNRTQYTAELPLCQQVLQMSQSNLKEKTEANASAEEIMQAQLDVVYAHVRLGDAKCALGDLAGAQHVYEKGVELGLQAAGPNHHRIAQCLNELGQVQMRRNRLDEADATLTWALKMREEMIMPDFDGISETLSFMGDLCLRKGEFKRAKGLLKRALQIAEARGTVPTRFPQALVMSVGLLSEVFTALKEHDRAYPPAARAQALSEQYLGPHHPHVASALLRVVICLTNQGKFEEAVTLMERALIIHEQFLGPDHIDVAGDLGRLGSLCLEINDTTRARTLLQRALVIKEKALGPLSMETGRTVHLLARVCIADGDVVQAKVLYQRAQTIMDRELGKSHVDCVAIRREQAVMIPRTEALNLMINSPKPCGFCTNMGTLSSMRCGRCKAAWYCNTDCQTKGWKEHRKQCKAVAEAATGGSKATLAASK